MTLTPDPTPEDVGAMIEVLKVVLSGALTAGGALIGGPPGAFVGAGLAQVSVDAVQTLSSRWQQRTLAQTVTVVNEAASMSGLSLEELVDALTRDPHTAALMAAALRGAAATTVNEKLLLFARVLANSATDSALIDEDFLVVQAINTLEAPHLRVMGILRREPPAENVPTSGPAQYWTGASISSELLWPPSSVTSVLLTLQAAGVVYLSATRIDGGSATWATVDNLGARVDLGDMACELTNFGERVLVRIELASEFP